MRSYANELLIKAQLEQGGAASHGKPPCRVDHPWPGRGQGPRKGATGCGQGQPAKAVPAGTTGGSYWQHDARMGAGYRAPVKGYCPRPALPPAGAAASAVGVADTWQGD
ncbi:hypothetical protein GW17_00031918 [Ensete ventricosum]|nr:hypothetical protein GW17_00031918 [Ensete ventricosum]RZS26055.1 hypothetical protein BHM03_00059338 [Ensete ventricosum]